ncbi:sensor histidine kinase [Saccharopolyspora sp. MS10]|uniref:sensor histidine kinase n=1 Tax=Saccharopolyspora sp. MS10 TaxID=3385973 RepID=UPI0039A0D074
MVISEEDEAARVRGTHRVLNWVTSAFAVVGVVIGYLILSGDAPAGAVVPPLLTGMLVQLAATAVIARAVARPHFGLLAALAVTALLYVLDTPWRTLVLEGAVLWVPLALSWSAARVAERVPARSWAAAVCTAAVLAYAVLAASWSQSGLLAALAAIAPVLGGIATTLARRLAQARRERIEALAREREAVARREQAEDRERLAADMHDNLGHVLTLLVLQANALAVSSPDPQARDAGKRIGELGGRGMGELRRLLALLDDPESGERRRPEVAAGSIAELVEQVRGAGQRVELVGADADSGLPPVLARTVHRVVQEGLTNARKHAPGAVAEVELSRSPEAVRLLVRNGPGGSGRPGAGRGLDGLRRRVELLGGQLRAEPGADGGFALRAELPLEPDEETAGRHTGV